jgi:hypothetical protein
MTGKLERQPRDRDALGPIPSPWPFFRDFAIQAAAWIIIGLGFIGPLTPSEGRPSAATILIWVGFPILVLWLFGRRRRSLWLRIFVATQAALMLWFTWIFTLSVG